MCGRISSNQYAYLTWNSLIFFQKILSKHFLDFFPLIFCVKETLRKPGLEFFLRWRSIEKTWVTVPIRYPSRIIQLLKIHKWISMHIYYIHEPWLYSSIFMWMDFSAWILPRTWHGNFKPGIWPFFSITYSYQ